MLVKQFLVTALVAMGSVTANPEVAAENAETAESWREPRCYNDPWAYWDVTSEPETRVLNVNQMLMETLDREGSKDKTWRYSQNGSRSRAAVSSITLAVSTSTISKLAAMTTAIPSIACLGVLGRNNNPLQVSIFPSHDPATDTFAPIRTPLQFSLLLSSTVDILDLRAKRNSAANIGLSGEVGLLHAVDDRLAAYGFETNTGVRMICVVDMRGRRVTSNSGEGAGGGGGGGGGGLREGELKPVFRAMQAAYVRLLQNPFYEPDEHAPLGGKGGRQITSKRFVEDMKRIGEAWTPGVTSL
ncbi:trafficking particle complex subunit 2 [Ophiocordyceps camponoti-floridani]|uniref:Trafficking particle complex subunit 2 n=1 Tax=Ophiocordyceps camponoti-floridani TaxID=2030778 RepID=A0A8H4Q9U4_9HYPO|nr:trafficking particle complex subunit 2 [Ophiocordyceps camponoti-floridani]